MERTPTQPRPEPSPEGQVISQALDRLKQSEGLSLRSAAKKAGVSDVWWRQIISGFRTVRGQVVPTEAPAVTWAKMALAVRVTPEEMEQAGRSDVAESMRSLSRSEEADFGKPFRIIDVALEDYTLEEQEQILQQYLEWKARDDDGDPEQQRVV